VRGDVGCGEGGNIYMWWWRGMGCQFAFLLLHC
jgi:hypothetical protein